MFDAKVFKVFIASPSDVVEERERIPAVINKWNSINSERFNVFLQPIKWEINAFPEIGDRPQALINSQIVGNSDILVGVFWTRLGSNTGKAISGTVEEINEFQKNNKPILLYFCDRDIPRDLLDYDQLKKLDEIKGKYQKEGVVFKYKEVTTLEELLFNHLTKTVEKLSNKDLPAILNPFKFVTNIEDIRLKLEALNKDKKWGEMSELLKEIQSKPEFKNIYNFFYGRLIVYNPHLNLYGPEPFLNLIDIDSDLFVRAQKLLVFYYSNLYGSDSENKELQNKLNMIANNLLKKGEELPYYYFLKLKTIDQDALEECNKLYNDFKEKCRPLKFDFENNKFKTLEINSDSVILNLKYPFEIPTLNFYFLVHLLVKAHNKGDLPKRDKLLKKVKHLYNLERLKQKESNNSSVKLKPFQFEFRNFFNSENEYFNILHILNNFDSSFMETCMELGSEPNS